MTRYEREMQKLDIIKAKKRQYIKDYDLYKFYSNAEAEQIRRISVMTIEEAERC